MRWLNIFRHLLPRSAAWSIIIDKMLTKFFNGLNFEFIKTYLDLMWLDIFPDTTRELATWEDQFAIPTGNFTEAERRARLDASWKFLGGQDPRYIQDALQANGFDVFVHEWWEPGMEPPLGVHRCVTPRNPFDYLRETNGPPIYTALLGETLMQLGETEALLGNTTNPTGYPLVNKIIDNDLPQVSYTTVLGEPLTQLGEPSALLGQGTAVAQFKNYTIPTDADRWNYFLYIGGETFPENASVDASRRDEFEDLCLKICPAQQWLGILVNYT